MEGVAGVQELQELQNENIRNGAPSADFLTMREGGVRRYALQCR